MIRTTSEQTLDNGLTLFTVVVTDDEGEHLVYEVHCDHCEQLAIDNNENLAAKQGNVAHVYRMSEALSAADEHEHSDA